MPESLCEIPLVFPSRRKARAAARAMINRIAYRCATCKEWHVKKTGRNPGHARTDKQEKGKHRV